MGAHPRSRGENGLGRPGLVWDGGSSPLTRGKPVTPGGESVKEGLIPAHAGKTIRAGLLINDVEAHPRSRGENIEDVRVVPTALGASPLTRGKPRLIRARAASSGRIPAHAGKTHQPRPGNSRPRAHPRSRGENCVRSLRNTGVLGASPLTRGKRDVQPPSGVHEGRIPAHAGKTMPQSTGDRQFWAHPRSRGENGWPERHITPNQGASPLTRGKPRLNVIYKTIARRIPAHAGKTWT